MQAREAAEVEQRAAEAAREAALAGQAAAEEAAQTARADAERAREELDAQLAEARRELAEAKAANAAVPDAARLRRGGRPGPVPRRAARRAGWDLSEPRDRGCCEVSRDAHGYRQGISWTTCCGARTGLPLAVVEAKRTRRDASAGRQQAKLYADARRRRSGGAR